LFGGLFFIWANFFLEAPICEGSFRGTFLWEALFLWRHFLL
jgi:hypothetical protein